MRNSIIKAYALGIITGGFLTAAIVLAAAPAKADGYISDDEAVFIELHGAQVCSVIDKYHSMGGVMGVAEAISEQGFSASDAVDIINASVQEYCPRNWSLLQAIGRAARATNGASA